MQDERGLYYYPVLQNKKLRMYIRPHQDEIAFRLWDAEDPTLWEEHGWVPWSAIQQAADLYREIKNQKSPPLHLYDRDIASRLIKDNSGQDAT